MLKNHWGGRNMQCKNSTKKEEIECHVDKDLLPHSPPKALNYPKAERKILHMKATLWTIRLNSKRYRKSPPQKYTHETLYQILY